MHNMISTTTSHKSTTITNVLLYTNLGITLTIHYGMEYKSSDLTVCTEYRYRIIYNITPRYLQLQYMYDRYGM